MLGRTCRKLLSLFVGLSWLGQSLVAAQPVAALSSPASVEDYPCDRSLLNFNGPNQGWVAEAYSLAYAKVAPVTQYPPENPVGGKSVGLDLNLEGDLRKKNDWAQFKIDLNRVSPGCAQGQTLDNRWWEYGSVLSLWVWAPEGTRGRDDFANGLHLYLVDDQDRKYYGTWQTFQENTWFEVTLKLGGQTPACSDPDPNFDFNHIQTLGLNIALNYDHPTPIHKSLWVSPLRIKSGILEPPASAHLYSFDAETKELPQWGIVTDPAWKAEAFTQNQIQDGTLVIGTDFHETQDTKRKGVMDLVFAPELHLRDTEPREAFISMDIKFDPPPDPGRANCPFTLMLWSFDSGRKVQYNSINQDVGSGEWTRVAFRLTDLRPTPGPGVDPQSRLSIASIGKIGFQIYDAADGYDYQGRILVDNIAIGGAVPFEQPPQLSFVMANGPHLMLDGERFRFIGANAEYLPYKSDPIVEQVLDRAQTLGIRVIRTWGFGEGCEDYSLTDCEELSPYFQPWEGFYNKSAFEHFDRIVYEAGRRNIHLIVPLVNNWIEYGGIPRYICWGSSASQSSDCNTRQMKAADHDRFYTDESIRKMYKKYMEYFVTHRNTITGLTYAEDPTIMAWELINEPRSQSDTSGQYLHEWIKEMSDYLAGLAPKQLIGTGEEGWYIMPQAQADKFRTWQIFDKNYWHYGVNWRDASCTKDWGSNGTDFLSNNSTEARIVESQTWVGKEASSPVLRFERAGVPAVDFTDIHLYLSPGETGLSYAPYCYYAGLDSLCASRFDTTQGGAWPTPIHQAREWIQEHVDTSHKVLQKPFILEEFNFPVPFQDPLQGSSEPDGNQFQVSLDERARLFEQYLDLAYDLDVDAALFWNLGYDGFMQQSWGEIDALKDWKVVSSGYLSDDTSRGIRFNYSPSEDLNAIELSNPQVDWLRAQGDHLLLDLINDGDAQEMVMEVQLAGTSLPRSKAFHLERGENQIMLDELFTSVEKLQSNTTCPTPNDDPPQVTRITIQFQKIHSSGNVLLNFRTFFNSKYVIYPDDPVDNVIRAAAKRWSEASKPVHTRITIDHSVTCDQDIQAAQVDEPLPVLFDLRGSIAHTDGYYYRYSIAAPRGQYELNFGSLGWTETGRVLVTANAIGKYEVKIAPEGESLDGDNAASCSFEVVNPPLFNISTVRIDDDTVQPSAGLYTTRLSLVKWKRAVQVWIADKENNTERFQVGCQLLKGNKVFVQQPFSCQRTPVETTVAKELYGFVGGDLPPGQYELRLWSEGEKSAWSDPIVIYFNIPNPAYYDAAFVLCLLAVIGFWQRMKLRSILTRSILKKSKTIDSK